MNTRGWAVLLLFAFLSPNVRANETGAAPVVHQGERLDPSLLGPQINETMEAAVARDRSEPVRTADERHGTWVVPPLGATYHPHSGERYITNKWGDPRMGIGFPSKVDVQGAYIAGQAHPGVWASGLRVVGYLNGEQVRATELFTRIGEQPQWFEMDLRGVDRIVIEAVPSSNGGGWYALDDLTFRPHPEDPSTAQETVVLDFEDLPERSVLTGSGYAGLIWETGVGDLNAEHAIPPPQTPPAHEPPVAPPTGEDDAGELRGGLGTAPTLEQGFRGTIRGDAGEYSYPPDSHGAVGPNHFVVTVNRAFAVFDKATGANLLTIRLGSFLPGSNGDPRVLFDHHSGRWIVVVSDFSSRIYIAVSHSDNPMGSWFKSSFATGGACFPDYETLGVDDQGIYTAAYMAGFCGMAIFAIEKAPLLDSTPQLGNVTAFRDLPFEGAIQPAHTYGAGSVEYFVSLQSSTEIRIRRVTWPTSMPRLVEVGTVNIPSVFSPPDAPALGSGTRLDTVGDRLMMAAYRDGSLWTAHTVAAGSRAAARWYEIDPVGVNLIQYGTVTDPVLHFFFPSIMVNMHGDAVMCFSGSSAAQYAAAYCTGRTEDDPAGEMAPPLLLKAGQAAQNNIDGYGRNRWGDYSYTTVDPVGEQEFWTIQEYAHADNIWGTWIGRLSFGDCNRNEIEDALDIAAGTSADCDSNGRPDECQLLNNDCDEDGVPDHCLRDALIVAQPVEQSVCPGDTAVYTVVGAGDDLTYVWKRNGVTLVDSDDVLGATTSALTLIGVEAADAGAIVAEVRHGCVTATSQAASLTLRAGPTIEAQPAAWRVVCDGAETVLVIAISGTEPFAYQWAKDGEAIPGGTGRFLSLGEVGEADAGIYTCRVENECAVVISSAAELVVHKVTIVEHPQDQCAALGGRVTFTVEATGPEPLQYIWKKNGVTIPGETGSTLTIDVVQPSHVGTYTVIPITVGSVCFTVSEAAALIISGDADADGVLDCHDACPGFDDALDCDADGWPDGCETPGDDNHDGLIDLTDFVVFDTCFLGPDNAALAGCVCTFDVDGDDDVDLVDFAAFQRGFSAVP